MILIYEQININKRQFVANGVTNTLEVSRTRNGVALEENSVTRTC